MIIAMITVRKSNTNSREPWVGAYLSCRGKKTPLRFSTRQGVIILVSFGSCIMYANNMNNDDQ